MGFTIRRIGEETPAKRWKKRALAVSAFTIRVLRPAVQIVAAWREAKEEEDIEREQRTLLKKATVILLAVLGAVAVLAIVLKVLLSLNLISAQSLLSVTASPLPKDAHGHTNILLLGQGDASHEGVDLTDTMMIASIDGEDTGSITLLSVPRDLYLLGIEGVQRGRINELYRNEKYEIMQKQNLDDKAASPLALKETMRILGSLMGVELHHVIKIDFIGVVEGVDAIGGVEVDVPYTIVDNEYPTKNYGYQTFMITKGLHTLDGETALKYARSRHSTSDFGRSARQQQLIGAIAEKMKTEGLLSSPGKLLELVSIAGKNMETSMTFGEMMGLAKLGKSLDRSRIVSVQLNDQNGLYGALPNPGGFLYAPPRDQFGGASVFLPVSIPEFPVTWKQIQAYTELLLRHRELYLPRLNVEIRNVDAPPGSASKLTWELTRYGFEVVTAKNAPRDVQQQGLASSVLFAPPQDAARAAVLGKLLGITVSTSKAPLLPDVGTGSTLILLGTDYEYQPIQDLLPRLTP